MKPQTKLSLDFRMYENLKEFLKLRHRIANCFDKECDVCLENHKVFSEAETLIEEYEKKRN